MHAVRASSLDPLLGRASIETEWYDCQDDRNFEFNRR